MKSLEANGVALKVPKYLWRNATFNRIGIFGNADPLDPTQWLEMTFAQQSDTPSLDASGQVCNGLTTSLHHEFLVGFVGTTSSPQAKILGARAFYRSEAVVFGSDTASQYLALTTSVSFVILSKGQYVPYAPPPPPVLWSVPYDVFYPFDISRGDRATASVSIVAVIAVAAAICVLGF
jgi:hypothetical protein